MPQAMVPGWLVVALAAFIIELVTPFFGFSLVGVAAVVAAAVAGWGRGLAAQFVAFGVSALFLLGFLRSRIARKLAESAPGVPDRAEKLVGRRGRVVEAIEPGDGRGRVDVDGTDWSAISESAVPEGAEVVVKGNKGIRLVVSPAEKKA